MGTRNLTAVAVDGQYKVAQYGQWDGHPEGQGATILRFLKGVGNIERLKQSLIRCRFLDADGVDKDFVTDYERNAPEWSNDPDNRTEEQKHWHNTFISRDLGGKILENISRSDDKEIILRNSINFAGDSLMCEYAYVVDLDKGTFEVYVGFNKKPVPDGERFSSFPVDTSREFSDGEGTPSYSYYQVVHRATFSLDDLPTKKDFLAKLEDKDEE